jgi:hypothetical protein
MALTSYTIDETSVGEVLTPADGFLTDLVMTTPPPVHEVSDHHSGLAFTQSIISSLPITSPFWPSIRWARAWIRAVSLLGEAGALVLSLARMMLR